MAFYRTYRPSTLSQIDNEAVRLQLTELLNKKKSALPHAFLFTGPKGAGKTTAARLLAKLFNCEKPDKTGAPCGTCDTCRQIAEARHLDVLELDAASNRGIDEIRELRSTIANAPSSASYKVYIIDEVHMLTTEAFNALLKTLEEPPPHAIFVLATTDPHKIPATITSRCIHISFARARSEDLMSALTRIVKEEKIPIDKEALSLIAQFADGAYRDAVKFLEQVSFHKGKITAAVVTATLSLSHTGQVDGFLKALANRDRLGSLAVVSDLVKQGQDIKSFLVASLTCLEALLIEQVTDHGKDEWNREDLRALIRSLSEAYNQLRTSPIPQLPLELAVVEFCEDKRGRDAEHLTEQTRKIDRGADSSFREVPRPAPRSSADMPGPYSGLLTLEKLTEHWSDVIATVKPFNHSIAGVLRSSRPKDVKHGIVTIEAFYNFHQEKLSEVKTRELLSDVLKKLFGERVKAEVVLGKK